MDVKQGFKQTEVGIIPSDWETLPLGRLTSSVEYGSSAKSSTTGRTPVLRMGNIQGGQIDWTNLVYTDDDAEISKYILHPGDVLFNRTNTIDLVGKAALFKGDRVAIFAGYLIRIKVDESLDSRFLNYILNTEFSKRYSAKILSVAVGQANINGQKLRTYPIPVPPTKAEQESIAEALSDADALIESLEQLIAKKRNVKQGVMDELLTGRRRLHRRTLDENFVQTEVGKIPGDWKLVQFRNALAGYIDYRGRTPRKLGLNWGGGDILALSANNVQMGHIDPAKEAYCGSELLYSKWMLQGTCERGDVLLTMEAPLGNVAQIPDNKKYILSQRVVLVRPQLWISRNFLANYMRGAYFQRQLRVNATGSTAQGIQRKKLDEIAIYLPSDKNEQDEIDEVISDMDSEIAALKNKLKKTRKIKQGMMQELLTGRIRLV